jgi:hypothetical protein
VVIQRYQDCSFFLNFNQCFFKLLRIYIKADKLIKSVTDLGYVKFLLRGETSFLTNRETIISVDFTYTIQDFDMDFLDFTKRLDNSRQEL